MSAYEKDNNPDNFTFKSGTGEANSVRESEHTMLASNMQRLRAKYSGYNRALADYLGSKGLEHDDAIDESILVSDNDNFKYGLRKN